MTNKISYKKEDREESEYEGKLSLNIITSIKRGIKPLP